MGVRLVYLGRLADLAGADERQVAVPPDWPSLMAMLEPRLAEELSCDRVRLAVNGVLLPVKEALRCADGDELAFLPPVSGG